MQGGTHLLAFCGKAPGLSGREKPRASTPVLYLRSRQWRALAPPSVLSTLVLRQELHQRRRDLFGCLEQDRMPKVGQHHEFGIMPSHEWREAPIP
jgi:hypothetical protein